MNYGVTDWLREQEYLISRHFFRPRVVSLQTERGEARFLIGDRMGQEWYVDTYSPSSPQLRWLLGALSPTDTIFEGGSHHGYFALVMAPLLTDGGLFVAIEPHPQNVEILRENLRLNSLSKVEVCPYTLGAESGWARILDTSNSRVLSPAATAKGRAAVPMITVDELAQKLGRRPTFLKLDVEDMEVEALRGATNIIRSLPKLSIEVHASFLQSRQGVSPNRVLSFLPLEKYDLWLQEDEYSEPRRVRHPVSLAGYDRVQLHGLPR